MRHKKLNSSVLETILKSDVEKNNAAGSLRKTVLKQHIKIICNLNLLERNFYLASPKEGEDGGGGGKEIAVSRVPLLSSYFCGWLSSFPVLASVEKKRL